MVVARSRHRACRRQSSAPLPAPRSRSLESDRVSADVGGLRAESEADSEGDLAGEDHELLITEVPWLERLIAHAGHLGKAATGLFVAHADSRPVRPWAEVVHLDRLRRAAGHLVLAVTRRAGLLRGYGAAEHLRDDRRLRQVARRRY